MKASSLMATGRPSSGRSRPFGLHVLGLGGLGLVERALGVLDREGVDLRVDLLGSRDDRPQQLDRRELARPEAAERLAGTQIAEFEIRHDSPRQMR
jgi:hypothetical protein